jgi:hypothetical protein
MFVPRYWFEFRLERTHAGRHIVVRRWGWSDDSQADATRHAESRALEAFHCIKLGETNTPRRERKLSYNGAEGTPIREEVVDRFGTAVVTRNAYGALCLNTPDVLFADIDHETSPPGTLSCLLVLLFTATALWSSSRWGLGGVLVAALVLLAIFRGLKFSNDLYRSMLVFRGGHEQVTLKRIQSFVTRFPKWGLRVYRTPAGLRLLATHAALDPRGDDATALFREMRADPIFVRMCFNQNCFRARLTPKPWRIGVDFHGWRSRRMVWPVPEDRLAERREWVARYEEAAADYAACEYLLTIGNPEISPATRDVVRYHDEMCRVDRGLPIA